MGDYMETISLVVVIVLSILLFLLFRAVVLWYWKIDRIVELLEQLVRINTINANTGNAQLGGEVVPVEEPTIPRAESGRHMTQAEFNGLTLSQQSIVKDYGYLLSPEYASRDGDALSNLQSSAREHYLQGVGEKISSVD